MALEAEELEYPEFLENTTEEDCHEKMLSNYPNEIDKTEGDFLWDVLRPVAIELSELTEFRLTIFSRQNLTMICEKDKTTMIRTRTSLMLAHHLTIKDGQCQLQELGTQQ